MEMFYNSFIAIIVGQTVGISSLRILLPVHVAVPQHMAVL